MKYTPRLHLLCHDFTFARPELQIMIQHTWMVTFQHRMARSMKQEHSPLAGPIANTNLSFFIFPFSLRRNSKNEHPSDVTVTADVGRQPQPWGVDATPNYGGTIRFHFAMVHFSQVKLGKSLTDITVRISPSAFKNKLNLAYFIIRAKLSD